MEVEEALERAVDGTDLVGGSARVPLRGTIADVAAAAGVTPEPPDLYAEHAELDAGAPLAVDAPAAVLLFEWFARGDAALRRFAPDATPVLWPEHFDLGVTVDEVNYGVSPGDAGHPLPYAYVGPWRPREGTFWNASFGAVCEPARLTDVEAMAAFFAAGRSAASTP